LISKTIRGETFKFVPRPLANSHLSSEKPFSALFMEKSTGICLPVFPYKAFLNSAPMYIELCAEFCPKGNMNQLGAAAAIAQLPVQRVGRPPQGILTFIYLCWNF
jgi:hypothetical protein